MERFWSRGERGATLVEYALLVAVIAAGSVTALQFLTDSASDRYEAQADGISDSGGGPDEGEGGEEGDGSTTTTTTTTPTTTTTTPPPAFAGASASCADLSCSFSVTDPLPGEDFSWSSGPPDNKTGSGPSWNAGTFSHGTGNSEQEHTIVVTAVPSGQQTTVTVGCRANSGCAIKA